MKRVEFQEDHKQHEFCYTRAPYRQGREFKAVKVYTINDESSHLIVQNVPAIQLEKELKKICMKVGTVEKIQRADDYPPMEAFTETYYVKFKTLKEAKLAKKRLDNRSFYGSLLHICYAPELESLEETELKLMDRERFVRSYASHKSQVPEKPSDNSDYQQGWNH